MLTTQQLQWAKIDQLRRIALSRWLFAQQARRAVAPGSWVDEDKDAAPEMTDEMDMLVTDEDGRQLTTED